MERSAIPGQTTRKLTQPGDCASTLHPRLFISGLKSAANVLDASKEVHSSDFHAKWVYFVNYTSKSPNCKKNVPPIFLRSQHSRLCDEGIMAVTAQNFQQIACHLAEIAFRHIARYFGFLFQGSSTDSIPSAVSSRFFRRTTMPNSPKTSEKKERGKPTRTNMCVLCFSFP